MFIVLKAKSRCSRQGAENDDYKQYDQHSEEISDLVWSSDTTAIRDDSEFNLPIGNALHKGKQEAKENQLQTQSKIGESEVNVFDTCLIQFV